MERYCKTVHLVLHLCKELKNTILRLQSYHLVVEYQFVCAVFVVFGKSRHGHRYPKCLQHAPHRRHLPLTTVGKYEVGQLRAFGNHTAVTSFYHLLHRSVIVAATVGLDDIFAILLFERSEVTKNHTRRHRLIARRMRIVEHLYRMRHIVQMKHFAYLVHQSIVALVGVELLGLCIFIFFVLQYITMRQIEQLLLVVAFGNDIFYPVYRKFGHKRH